MIRKLVIVVLTLAAVLTTWLTVESYRHTTNYYWAPTAHDDLIVTCAMGGITLNHFHSFVTPFPQRRSSREISPYADDAMKAARKTLTYFYFDWYAPVYQPSEYSGRVIAMPLWLPFAVFAAYPTIAFIRGPLRRWRRQRRGLCAKCAYDLTGNESGVCSECGLKVKQP